MSHANADRKSRTPTLDELARAFDPKTDDIVFVSGSRLEGLGNEGSDYDIYVIQKDGFSGLPFVTLVLDRSYVVYESFSESHVRRVAETINTLCVSDFPSVWRLSWNDVEFYYRVLIGRALTNEAEFAGLKARFHRDAIAGCVHVWAGLRSAVHRQQARQQLALGKRIRAYVSAQQAAACAVDSFLAAHGEPYPGFKWRFEKLRRCGGTCEDVRRRFWALKAIGPRSLDGYVAEVEAFCQQLGMGVFDDWSVERLTCTRIAGAHLVTVAGITYVIENHSTVFQLSDAARLVWEWMEDSPTRRALAARAESEQVMSADDMYAFLSQLEEHGLIR